MKGFVGEYGRIAIVIVIAVPILLFLFSTGSNSFQGQISEAKPQETVKSEVPDVDESAFRKKPTLEIQKKKLAVNQTYDLLSNEFVIKCVNHDGTKLTPKVTKIVYQNFAGSEETVIEASSFLTPDKKGTYKVTYFVRDPQVLKLKTEKTVLFVVD